MEWDRLLNLRDKIGIKRARLARASHQEIRCAKLIQDLILLQFELEREIKLLEAEAEAAARPVSEKTGFFAWLL